MTTKQRVLLISPHLDDAVFSAGELAAALATQGHEVHILTCFTQSVEDPQGFALDCQLDKGLSAEVDYMQLRRLEDQEACRLLNATPHWGDLPEAPHRGYDSAAALFQDIEDQDQIADPLLEVIKDSVKKLQPQLVFSPLGIGNHVDHQQVCLAVDKIKISYPELLYVKWYDQPYLMRNPEQLNEHPVKQIDLTVAQLQSIAETKNEKPTCFRTDSVSTIKLQACAAYKSQVDFQFGSTEKLAAHFQDSDQGEHQFREYFITG